LQNTLEHKVKRCLLNTVVDTILGRILTGSTLPDDVFAVFTLYPDLDSVAASAHKIIWVPSGAAQMSS